MDPEIIFVVGTRPEIIKAYPLIEYAYKKNYPTTIIFSRQHYLDEMSQIFFSEFKISPDIVIEAETTLERYTKIIELIKNLRDSIIFVIGDTSTVLYTGIGYSYNTTGSIVLAHIESGLHSLNPLSTEEKIRSMVERISDLRFTPSKLEEKILAKMGISKRVFSFGNPIYNMLERANIKPKDENYILVTFHRRTNVERKEILENSIKLLEYASKYYPIKYVTHPTTMSFLKKYNMLEKIEQIDNLELLEPMGYKDFLRLEARASFIITDSGGVQEEAMYFKKITLILRPSTPRWVAIRRGVHFLANPSRLQSLMDKLNYIIEHKREIEERYRAFKNPYYNPNCSKNIIETAVSSYNEIIQEKFKFDLSKLDISGMDDNSFLKIFRI